MHSAFSRMLVVPALLGATVLLSGCNSFLERPSLFTEEVLSKLEGPKLKGMGGTLMASAKNAEAEGDYKKASVFYQQLVDKEPENVVYLQGYADARRRSGDYEVAIKLYDKILSAKKPNVAASEGKGLALLSLGKYDEAGGVLSEVMKLDGKRWRTLNAMGLLFVSQGMHDEAVSYFTEALRQDGNNTTVLNNVGLALAIDQNFDGAIESLNLASGLASSAKRPMQEHIGMNLALVYGIKGDIENAERVASRYLDGAALENNLGIYAHLSNDDVLAKSYLDMALSSGGRYYDKAWKNLEAISDSSTGIGKKKGKRLPKSKSVKID